MARRRGRPSLSGKRKPSGRLRGRAAVADQGNMRVQAMRSTFSVFQGGKAGNELGDAIGKAWAAGLLDGHGVDSQLLRDAGRDFGRLWTRCFGSLGVRTSSLERRMKAASPAEPGVRGAAHPRFVRMDSIVSTFPRQARDAFYGLCIDYQDSDSMPPFLERLINERLALKARAAGTLPIRGDREKMGRAVEILKALVEGGGRR